VTDIDRDAIWTAAAEEGRRMARLAFERRGNRGSLHLTESQLETYVAISFESGVYWALKQTRK